MGNKHWYQSFQRKFLNRKQISTGFSGAVLIRKEYFSSISVFSVCVFVWELSKEVSPVCRPLQKPLSLEFTGLCISPKIAVCMETGHHYSPPTLQESSMHSLIIFCCWNEQFPRGTNSWTAPESEGLIDFLSSAESLIISWFVFPHK